MKFLGIDYGDARIGLSTCDSGELLATPLKTYRSQTMRKDIDAMAAYAHEIGAEAIVLGLPLNMDGTFGPRAEKTQAFGKVLERVAGLSVIYWDERLTTVSAEEQLIERGLSREKRREIIDTVSAQIILQSYLDSRKKIKGSN